MQFIIDKSFGKRRRGYITYKVQRAISSVDLVVCFLSVNKYIDTFFISYFIFNNNMGDCYSKQQIQQSRSAIREVRPVKCVISDKPLSVILELSNGNVENIEVTKKRESFQIRMEIAPGIYMGARNQLYLLIQANDQNQEHFLEALHTFYQTINVKQAGLIEPLAGYLIKKEDKFYFIVESKPLGDQSSSFTDLVQLGKKMKQEQITWQDLEYSEIISQVCRRYNQIIVKQSKINNIFIGTDGSVHLLAFFHESSSRSRDIENLKSIMLQGLYGTKIQKIQACNELQKKLKFKHPTSLSFIRQLYRKIQDERKENYKLIVNPSLKFIKDYIKLFYFKLQSYSPTFIDNLILLSQYQKAYNLLSAHMISSGQMETINEESYGNYLKLHYIQSQFKPEGQQTLQSRKRVSTAACFLGNLFKKGNKFGLALKYYNDYLQYSDIVDEAQYLSIAQIYQGLSLNQEVQKILGEGLYYYPKSKQLYLINIIYLCDSLRIEEAEKLLFKATECLQTLQMQICSAKILLSKSVLNSSQRIELIHRSQQQLSKIVVQGTSKDYSAYSLSYYHQILGDSYFQQHDYSKAQQQYHIAQVILKNKNVFGYRISVVKAAQANCYLMSGKFQESINIYNEAESFLSLQCKTLRDSIVGNRAIAKIRSGRTQQGKGQLQYLLKGIKKETLESDYNYIFLKNVLEAMKVPKI